MSFATDRLRSHWDYNYTPNSRDTATGWKNSLRNYAPLPAKPKVKPLHPKIDAPRPAAPSARPATIVNRVASVNPKETIALLDRVKASTVAALPQAPRRSGKEEALDVASEASPRSLPSLSPVSEARAQAVPGPNLLPANVQKNADRLAQFVSVSGHYFERGGQEFRPLVHLTDEESLRAVQFGNVEECDGVVTKMMNSAVPAVVSNLNTQIHMENFSAGTLLDNTKKLESERSRLLKNLHGARKRLDAAQTELRQALANASISPADKEHARLLKMPLQKNSIFVLDETLTSQVPEPTEMPKVAPARGIICSKEQVGLLEELLREVEGNYDRCLHEVVLIDAKLTKRAAKLAGNLQIDTGAYDAILDRSYDTLQRATKRKEHLSAYKDNLLTQVKEIRDQTESLDSQREQIASVLRNELSSR